MKRRSLHLHVLARLVTPTLPEFSLNNFSPCQQPTFSSLAFVQKLLLSTDFYMKNPRVLLIELHLSISAL